ncbi:MAG TPA: hypothetical protein VK983_01805 [Candidatus Limnocylindrales bacterium]|nr:hypothetical protein [Candidatus Limnocylindrales bacterium]
MPIHFDEFRDEYTRSLSDGDLARRLASEVIFTAGERPELVRGFVSGITELLTGFEENHTGIALEDRQDPQRVNMLAETLGRLIERYDS